MDSTVTTTMEAEDHQQMTKMSAMSGADFDRAYIKMMVSDHRKDVSEFEKESTRGADPDLKAFATKSLPTLREHLQMAEALNGGAHGGKTNSNMSGTGTMNSNMNSNMSGTGNMNGNMNSNMNRNSNSNRNSNRNGNSNRNNNGNNNGNSNSNRP